jgi:hypothetical protein
MSIIIFIWAADNDKQTISAHIRIQRKDEKYQQGNLDERDHFADLDVAERVILKLILKKWDKLCVA